VIKPAMLIVADWHPFTNCPSRSGYFGVWNFTDVASRKPFSYCSEFKGNFLACAQKFKREELDPLNLKRIGFHSDSDSAALSTESTKWLLDIGVRQASSHTDTPEMNSVAELTNRELYQMTLSMLIHSNMSVTFWEDAYQVASMTKGYITVKNSLGYTPPNIKHLRTLGCRAWVQEPRVEARKDFHPRGAEGKLIGYSDLPKGWSFWIPEIKEVAVSVYATFDEDISEKEKEYFLELEPCLVPLETIEGSLSTYKFLALKHFIDPDDNLLYQVTRVKCLKDRTIVGYVRRVMEGHTPREIRQPIHARDIEQMVNRTDQSSQNIQVVLREMVSKKTKSNVDDSRARTLNEKGRPSLGHTDSENYPSVSSLTGCLGEHLSLGRFILKTKKEGSLRAVFAAGASDPVTIFNEELATSQASLHCGHVNVTVTGAHSGHPSISLLALSRAEGRQPNAIPKSSVIDLSDIMFTDE
jgi:hypothetical protein